jgi:tRNA G26 N,N-dimethylase Trm1
MRHTSYGYIYENGKLVIEEVEAEKLKALFKAYLELSSLKKAGEQVSMICTHPTIKRRLMNPIYLGDKEHPKIIEEAIFDAVQEKLKARSRTVKKKKRPEYKAPKFTLLPSDVVKNNPYEEAEAIYERIEEIHGKK